MTLIENFKQFYREGESGESGERGHGYSMINTKNPVFVFCMATKVKSEIKAAFFGLIREVSASC